MSEGLNKCMLIGNLGADGELRFTQSGQAVLNLRLAINETYLDKDKNRRERVEWVSVTVWGKRAEGLSKILRKGSSIFVEGSLRTSSYDDRDGAKRYKTEVVANNILLAGGRPGGSASEDTNDARGSSDPRRAQPATGYGGRGGAPPRGAPAASNDQDDYGAAPDMDDDIPF